MENSQSKTKPSYPAMLVRIYAFFLLTMSILFILAGRLTYWQGWLFGGTYFILLVIISIKFTDRKDLIYERLKPGPSTSVGFMTTHRRRPLSLYLRASS